MQHFRITTLMTACATLVVLLSVLPQQAAGGVCEALAMPKQCVQKSDIAREQVGAGKLDKHAVTTEKLAPLSVGGGKLKDGAVTDAKLAPDAVFMRTLIVRPVGPTASDNCDELRAALNSIRGNSASNPYLIKLEPGIYDCGSKSLVMRKHVDIEGSGRGITEIRGNPTNVFGVVRLADHTELRHLSVTNLGGGNTVKGIETFSIGAPRAENFRITDVTVTVSNATGSAIGIQISANGDVALTHVTALADSAALLSIGIEVIGSDGLTMELSDVFAEGRNATDISIGLSVVPAIPDVANVFARNSTFVGSDISINDPVGGRLSVATSQLVGGQVGGTPLCVNSFDGNLAPLGANCQ